MQCKRVIRRNESSSFSESALVNMWQTSMSISWLHFIMNQDFNPTHNDSSSLYINTALLLWAFNIREDSAASIDTMNFTDNLSVRPLPFKAIFEPRVDNLQDLVESHLG